LNCSPAGGFEPPLLFGSRARGNARADSDLDLLINAAAATAAQWKPWWPCSPITC